MLFGGSGPEKSMESHPWEESYAKVYSNLDS